jgi:molybdopterin molybdotransferase
MVLARKLVSSIGVTEICGVRRVDDRSVEPVASFAEAGIGALTRADGFVVLPEGSEGGAEGSRVTVYFFRP